MLPGFAFKDACKLTGTSLYLALLCLMHLHFTYFLHNSPWQDSQYKVRPYMYAPFPPPLRQFDAYTSTEFYNGRRLTYSLRGKQ
jgi:hypothetical protein